MEGAARTRQNWDGGGLQVLLLVRSFLLVGQEESSHLNERRTVHWDDAETLYNVFVGSGGQRKSAQLQAKWKTTANDMTTLRPLLEKHVLFWQPTNGGTVSEQSEAFKYVALCLRSLKVQNKTQWPRWCIELNIGAGPFVFLYRFMEQVRLFEGSYV